MGAVRTLTQRRASGKPDRPVSVRPKWEIAGWAGLLFGVAIQLTTILGAMNEDAKLVATLVGCALVLMSFTANAVILPRMQAKHAARTEAAKHFRLIDRGYPTIEQADRIQQLGLHPNIETVPYLQFGHEDEIATALMNREMVLVVGPALSGKSRLVIESLARDRDLSRAPLVVPNNPAAVEYLLGSNAMPKGGIVFIDDFREMVEVLTADRLKELNDPRRKPSLRLVAMLRAEDRRKLTPQQQAVLSSRFRTILLEAGGVDLSQVPRGILRPEARQQMARFGVGRYVAGALLAQKMFDDAEHDHRWAHGILTALTDWARSGIAGAPPAATVRQIARIRSGLASEHVAAVETDEESEAWLLNEQSNGIRWLTSKNDRWYPHPVLTAALLPKIYRHPTDGELPGQLDVRIPPDIWDVIATSDVPAASVRAAARRAGMEYPAGAATETLWRRLASTGDVEAEYELALVLQHQKNHAEAVAILRRLRDIWPPAAFALRHLDPRGGVDPEPFPAPPHGDNHWSVLSNMAMRAYDAESLDEVSDGDYTAAVIQATLLAESLGKESPRTTQLINRAHEVFDSVDRDAYDAAAFMWLVGFYFRVVNRLADAERSLRVAAEYGWPASMVALAGVLATQGSARESEFWSRRHLSMGPTADGYLALAEALLLQDRLPEALACCDKALLLEDSGRVHNNRGRCLIRLKMPAEAASAFESGTERGNMYAAYNLYQLRAENAGDGDEETLALLIRAARAGVPDAVRRVRALATQQEHAMGQSPDEF